MRQLLALLFALQLSAFPLAGSAPKKAPAKKKPDLAQQIQAILRQPQLASAEWGIDAVDMETGKVIYSTNADHLFLPASNAKLLTTSAALAIAGPDYRFLTTVETTGLVDAEGRLKGDLVLVGRGDPNISGRVMPYQLKTERISPHTQILEDLANQLVQKGVKSVEGDLVGDDSYYSAERYAEGWAQDDLQWIDGAAVSALSFNDNVLFVKVQPGGPAGSKAIITTDPPSTYYEFDNRVVTSAAGVPRKVGVHRDPGSYKVLLWGTIPPNDAGLNEALTVEDPAEFTAQIFRGLLEARGITISGKVRARHGDRAQFFDQPAPVPAAVASTAPPLVLAQHISLPLLEDIARNQQDQPESACGTRSAPDREV